MRVREGGEVLQSIALDRGCFACALGGQDGRLLYMVTNRDGEGGDDRSPAGQVVSIEVEYPGVGRP